MTIVSDQTQPIVRNPNTTLQSDTLADPPVPSNVKTASSNQKSFYDTIIRPLESAVIGAADNVIAALVASNKRLNTRRISSPGQLSPGSTDYTNRPTITVVRNTTVNAKSVEVPVGDFADWFLSAVQEQDLERTDITETFGAPHIFASGRFTRKIVFSGMVRTTAHNFSSNIAANRVPQHVLLRNFYENFLRATAQAQMNYFTRITVDGDVYEGYIINLQLPRDAGTEMVMPFALTMICVRRYNVYDADALASLSVFKSTPDAHLPPAFAAASMKDATGDFKLSLEANNTTSDTIVTVNVGKVKQDGSYLGVKPVINLHASFGGQIITVKGNGAEVWSGMYDDGTPVSGTACREGARAIILSLASFAKLSAAGTETSGQAAFDLQFSAGGKEGPTLRISSVTSDKPQLKIKSLSVRMANGALIPGTTKSNSLGGFTVPNGRSHFVQSSPGVWDAIFDIEIELATLDLVTLTADDLPSPVASYCSLEHGGELGLRRGGHTFFNSVPADKQIVPSEPDFSALVIDSTEPGIVKFQNIKFSLNTTADVSQVNPFVLAEAIDLNFQPKFSIPDYDVLGTGVAVTLELGASTLLKQLFTGIKVSRNTRNGNKWEFNVGAAAVINQRQARPYTAVLLLKRSPDAAVYGVTDEMISRLLTAASFTFQYSQGALTCRFYQRGLGSLNFSGGVRQFATDTRPSNRNGDPAYMAIEVEFDDLKGIATDSLETLNEVLNVIGNPVSIALNFPASYSLPGLRASFS